MSNVTELNGSGGRLVTADGRTLPLRGATLKADARGGVARVVLEQRFENVYDEPLHVTYLMPLPADGAVSGYAFTLGARRVVGEVDKKQRARERFEQAILDGRTAGLVDQERSSLFTQELGNVPPKETIVAELTLDQRLTWLDEGAWEWRFPTVVGPRYQGAPGRVVDAARTEVAVNDGPLPVRIALTLTVRDAIPEGRKPESPLHKLAARSIGNHFEVGFAEDGGVRLDRDVVVRWPVAAPRVGLQVDVGRPAKGDRSYGLLSIVPPSPGSAAARARRRDLILLLDTSGSMGGEPLDQSRRTCLALIDTLSDDDTLEMIEFSTSARRWKRKAVPASAGNKQDARSWLTKLEAGGGTEMVQGVMAALEPLSGEAQRQVVLLTDGYIGFETEVVKAVADKLPAGSRLHVVGVGSAVNRSLTGPTSRAGRGVEVIVAPGEDPERPVMRLLARTAQPIVTDLQLSGDALLAVAPARLPDLFAGSPALAAVALSPDGGTLIVRGRTASGAWEERVQVKPCAAGEGTPAAAPLFARETVEDLELKRAAGGDARELDESIEAIGLKFQISTRLTTWIAVSQEVTVDPGAPTRREEVPQELPHGVSMGGLGLRGEAAAETLSRAAMMPMSAQAPAGAFGGAPPAPASPMRAAPKAGVFKKLGGMLERTRSGFRQDEEGESSLDDKTTTMGESPADLPEAAEPEQAKDAGVEKETKREVAKPKPSQPKKRAARRRAILRLRRGREWIFEIRVEGDALDWDPPSRASIELADGTRVGADVDEGKTTRAGEVRAGQVIRLVITLDGDAGEPRLLQIGDLELEVETA
jgi:Ca-activated chloride channel family protein